MNSPSGMIFYEFCPLCSQPWDEIERELQCCRECEFCTHDYHPDWAAIDKSLSIYKDLEQAYDNLTNKYQELSFKINNKEGELYNIQKEIDRKKTTQWAKLRRTFFNEKSKIGKIMTILLGLTVGPALITGPIFGYIYLFPNANLVFAVLWMVFCMCVFAVTWSESQSDKLK